jgi:CheY-like chemotaxis protein
MTPALALSTPTIREMPISNLRAVPTPTILIVEDYADTRELLATLLRRKGYRVIEAEDGVEGLLKAGAFCPDLILMDLSLPEMDGVEAARHIHAQPKLAHTPIFVVSAFLTDAVRTDVRLAGCVAIFPKPFDTVALLEKIDATLSNL